MRHRHENPESTDFDELEMLLFDAVGGQLAEPDRERLNFLLRESAEARSRAAELLFDDALLVDSLSAAVAEEDFKEATLSRGRSRPVRNRSNLLRIAAAVTLGVGALFWMLNRPDAPAVATPMAFVQSTNRVSGLEVGQTLQAGDRVEMEEGRAVLRFASGAKFSVEAPAAFTVTGANGADLVSGRGTVRVPGKIKGFTLVTPTERVVDLGTAFGIEVADSGATSVAVFEGEVELRGGSQPRKLFAGQSTQSLQPRSPARSIPHLIDAFLNTWETSFGVESVEGDLRVARPGERLAPGLAEDPSSLLLFPERESVILPVGYPLNSTRTGLHQRPFRKQLDLLEEPLTVDSYLLQYHPGADPAASREDRVFTAKLHFDRPVVGLILGADRLKASDADLAMPGARLQTISRRGINVDDQVELSEDRRTLSIRMSIRDSVDQIRVLVDANAVRPGSGWAALPADQKNVTPTAPSGENL